MAARSKKITVQFVKNIPAGTTDRMTYEIVGAGTVESIYARFYPGQQNTLKVHPWLMRAPDRPEELITFPTGAEVAISGDDDELSFPLDVTVGKYDKIIVDVQNTGAYEYTLVLHVVIDYEGGEQRVVATK